MNGHLHLMPTAQPAASSFAVRKLLLSALTLLMGIGGIVGASAQTITPDATAPAAVPATAGPIRLPQPREAGIPTLDEARATAERPAAAYVPGEFERFVQQQAGPQADIRRFGAELVTGSLDARGAELSPLVPSDYVVAPGDEVLVTLWGSVDADLRLLVDRAGRITVPRVGTIQVSGVRHADLADVVSRRVATVFKNYQISVTLGQLRGIRIFVSGFVVRPGTYTVSSLSTVLGALMKAGGPAASGSFRAVELRRNGRLIASFDLYELLLKGDRSADQIVQAGDVVHVGPVGIQVGVIGSVNKPSVIELRPGETVADALRIAGGLSPVADRSRLAIERLQDRQTSRVAQLELPADLDKPLGSGDVVRAFSTVDLLLPSQRRSKRVRVEGEVIRPADYVLPEGSSIADALRAAGGLTSAAYLFATEFTRESVRATQQENYERAVRDLETDAARMAAGRRVSSSNDEAVAESNRSLNRLIDRLRTLKPNGRIVLQMNPQDPGLPDLALEDGDRLYIPPRPTTVGVFGSVFNPSSYLFQPGRNIEDFLHLAGGPTKGADQGSIFVVRANGHVVSERQGGGRWFGRGVVRQIAAQPGDTVFVPEELDKLTFVQAAKDWTQILYQLGLGAAGIKAALN